VHGSFTNNSYDPINCDPKYKSYRALQKPVENVLEASGVHLSNGGGLGELEQFQAYLSDYKIIVFDGLKPDRVIFSENSLSTKKLYVLYDSDAGHYNVITNIKAALAKRYMCEACDTLYDNTHKGDKNAPNVLLHRPVSRICRSIVEHVTGGFSLRNQIGRASCRERVFQPV
jgi:hypothetical protein